MSYQDRQHPADSTIFERWISIATGVLQGAATTVYAKIVSIRGDITSDNPLPVAITSDIEIGAVELKDGESDTRAKVGTITAIAETDNGIAVQAPVLGATTDAAVTSDANGSLSAKLRGLVKMWNDIWDSVNHVLRIVVSNQSISASSELTRPSGTSLTAGMVIGTSFAVNGATNASPIILDIGTHGLTVGQFYRGTTTAIGGNTNANGDFAFKPTDATHVQIYQQDEATPVAGNSNYTSGGTLALLHRFSNVFNSNGGKGNVVKVRIEIETNAAVSSPLSLYLYDRQIAATLDGAVKSDLYANNAYSKGYLTIIPKGSQPAGSDKVMAVDGAISFHVGAKSDAKELYGILITETAITLQASKRVFVEITVENKQ